MNPPRVPSGMIPEDDRMRLRKLMDECARVDRMALRDFKFIIVLAVLSACYEVFHGEVTDAVPPLIVLLLAASGHRLVKRDEDERLVREVMED